ncbi:MAG: DUF3800 domain-containing protein [Isosphaeraceae bacterium]
MSWLLFLDESGHDHKSMPYEVRGGVAIHAGELWPFVRAVQRLELDAYGTELSLFRKELKGATLLDKDRFRWAAQGPPMAAEERRKHCRGFLTRGLEKKPPSRPEFTAYGQGCLEMARGLFQALADRRAVLFAVAIPRTTIRPPTYQAEEYLRKDQVFLLERFFYFLESHKQHGLLVLDEVDKTADRDFVKRLQRYFAATATGRYRSQWIVPAPFFVASDMAYPIQAADLCIYCVNWGFRLPSLGMDAEVRSDVADEFRPWLDRLQFRGEGYRHGSVFKSFGIAFVSDPYNAGSGA